MADFWSPFRAQYYLSRRHFVAEPNPLRRERPGQGTAQSVCLPASTSCGAGSALSCACNLVNARCVNNGNRQSGYTLWRVADFAARSGGSRAPHAPDRPKFSSVRTVRVVLRYRADSLRPSEFHGVKLVRQRRSSFRGLGPSRDRPSHIHRLQPHTPRTQRPSAWAVGASIPAARRKGPGSTCTRSLMRPSRTAC